MAVALVTGVSYLSEGHAKPQGGEFNNIAPPDEKGPYNVGIRTFDNVLMSAGRKTRIQVFYPTNPIDPTIDPTDCPDTYTIEGTIGGVGVSYQRSSPLCAIQNATVASGIFPMVVHDHGGPPPGAERLRLEELPVFETLASHGFFVVVALHSGNAVARVRDLPIVINYMLGLSTTPSDPSNPLTGSIDPNRIGISGTSAGGLAVRRVAGGWVAQGIAADPRIKAMILYEPEPDAATLTDASNISFSYMVMGGNRFNAGLKIPELFEATVLATPRIYVFNPEALHFGYFTDLCSLIDETREAALLADPTLPEPLTNMIPPSLDPNTNPCVVDPITGLCRRVCDPTMGTNNLQARFAALDACSFWNRGELNFPNNGTGIGGGANMCTRVGVNSILPLDTDGDGFTDSPPFLANDVFNTNPSTVEPPMPSEILVPMVKLYTVAFWKKFLEGDGRYMRYLTPGYANVLNLESVVEIRE